MKSLLSIYIITALALYILIPLVYSADTQEDFDLTKPRINDMQQVNPNLPTTQAEQKGKVWEIIAKVFGTDGKIGNIFLKILDSFNSWDTDSLVKFDGSTFQPTNIYEVSGNVGISTSSPEELLDVAWSIRSESVSTSCVGYCPGSSTAPDWNSASVVGGKFVDGDDPDDAVYTDGNVGIGTDSPVSSLDVAGGVKVGVDTACDATKAGTLAWNDVKGTLEVCGDDGNFSAVGTGASELSSIINGWPDALYCETNYGYDIIYNSVIRGDIRRYQPVWQGANQGYYLDFDEDGQFVGTGSGFTEAGIDCDMSIDELYDQGKAFNFIGGGGGEPYTYCTNENSDGDGNDDVAACVAAASNSGVGDGQYRAMGCNYSSSLQGSGQNRWDGTSWQYYSTKWNDCSDGTTFIQNMDTTLSGGGMFVEGDDPTDAVYTTGNVGIGTTTPSYKLEVNGSAGKAGGGSWTNSSDLRLKDVLGSYQKGLSEILALNPIKFTYKKDNARNLDSETLQIGFVAQEVQPVFPEAVSTGEDGYLDFNMHAINVALVKAIQEQQSQIEELKARIETLEN